MADDRRRNILFIITDQQRADCLSGAGHPIVQTPNLDHLAARGIRFSNAYVQASPCGPSRMCIHTGRYMHAHRSAWNEVSLPCDERTTGTYFGEAGYRVGWVGKSGYVREDFYTSDPHGDAPLHDWEWYAALRDTEDWAFDMGGPSSPYAAYLRENWHPDEGMRHVLDDAEMAPDCERAGWTLSPEGELLSPAEYRASQYPTVIPADHGKTAFLTNRAMDFLGEASTEDRPWMLILNYTSPHAPWVAPAPYHEMYDPADVPFPNRHLDELKDPHPLHRLYRIERGCPALDDEAYCRLARAVYYGMISEIDHDVGRLLGLLEQKGLGEDTIIVFMSDHGEYVGDHWLCFKEFWYDEGYRVPLIIHDPSPDAASTRGNVQDALVEEIDVLPTLMACVGLEVPYQIQGRSLTSMIRDGVVPSDWRTEVHADWDFRFHWASRELGLRPDQCRAWMIRDREFNYVRFNGLPDILYDLQKDPQELHNVADVPQYLEVVEQYRLKLLDWRMSTEDNSRIGWTYRRRPRFGMNPFRFRSPWPPYH